MVKMFAFTAFQLEKSPNLCHTLPGLEQRQNKCESISPDLGAGMGKAVFFPISQKPPNGLSPTSYLSLVSDMHRRQPVIFFFLKQHQALENEVRLSK